MASSVRSSFEDSAPELNPSTDQYAKVIESRGKGQFQVTLPEDTTLHTLYMPPKFRNALWIRRGSFVIVRRYSESKELELMHVLTGEQVKELKREGKWPKEFFDREIEVGEQKEQEEELADDDEFESDNFEQ